MNKWPPKQRPTDAEWECYKTRWNVYHTILCIGVWGIFICTLIGIVKGWGPW
jgi:hypothetical protein